MQRPMVSKIDEEIKATARSLKAAEESKYFADARVRAIQKRIDSLRELRARVAEGQMEFSFQDTDVA